MKTVGLMLLLVLILSIFVIGAQFSFKYWKNIQAESLEARKFTIIEGKSFGLIDLGMSPEQVKERLKLSASRATRTKRTVTYEFGESESTFHWFVSFDPRSDKAVAISYRNVIPDFGSVSYDTEHEKRRYEVEQRGTIPYETTKGGRYGQDVETIEAIYGDPSEEKKDLNTYYFEKSGLEFYFWCAVPTEGKCNKENLIVDRITLFAPGWYQE